MIFPVLGAPLRFRRRRSMRSGQLWCGAVRTKRSVNIVSPSCLPSSPRRHLKVTRSEPGLCVSVLQSHSARAEDRSWPCCLLQFSQNTEPNTGSLADATPAAAATAANLNVPDESFGRTEMCRCFFVFVACLPACREGRICCVCGVICFTAYRMSFWVPFPPSKPHATKDDTACVCIVVSL